MIYTMPLKLTIFILSIKTGHLRKQQAAIDCLNIMKF